MQYYFANGDDQKGPFPIESLAAQGLKRDSLVWCEGMAQWQQADSLAELASVIQQLPAVAPSVIAAAPATGYPAANAPLYAQQNAPMGLGYQQPYYGSQPPAGMAIASMVLGIVSIATMCFYGLGLPCAIIAIILGHIARGKARRGEGGGAGMATAGMVCGYIALGILVIFISIVVIALVSANHH